MAHGAVGLLASRGVVAATGLVTLPVLYDQLGQRDLGIWVMLSGLIGILSMLDLGLGSSIVRAVASADIARPSQPTRVVLALGLVWGLFLGVLAIAALLLCWPRLTEALHIAPLAAAAQTATLVLLCGLVFDGVAMPWRGVLEGTQRYPALAVVNAGIAVLAAVWSVATVLDGGGLVDLAIVVAATSALRSCLVIGVARHGAPGLSPSLTGFRREDLRAVTGYGLKVQVTSATGVVNLEVDRFVLSGFFGPSVVAGFELGARWANLFRLVPAFVLLALFPMAVAQTVRRAPGWLDQFQLRVTKYLTAIAATGAAVLVVSADPLIRAWLGRPTAWAAASIVILVPAYALNLAAGATAIMTRVEGRPGRETGYALLSAGLNLALTWPLLSLLGPVGVPLATAIGIAVGTGYFLFSYQRVTRRALTPLLQVVLRPLLAALVAGGAVALVADVLPDGPGRAMAGLAVASRSFLVLVLTAVLLAAVGFFGDDERVRLRRLLGRRGHRLLPLTGGEG